MAKILSRVAKALTSANSLERKIYFYRVDAGKKNGKPVAFDPVPILQHISHLKFDVAGIAGRYMNTGGGNLIYVDPVSLEYPQKLTIVLSRRTNLPEIESAGAMTSLPLPEGGGLGEKTHVMFFGEYAAADFNFYGPRATKLSEYFSVKAKKVGSRIKLDHLIRGEAVEELKRQSGIVLARFKCQESALPLIESANESLGAAFRAVQRFATSDEIEVVVRKKKGRFLSAKLFKTIGKLAAEVSTHEQFDTLSVEGVNRETEEHEKIDILDDKLILHRRILKTDKNGRAVSTESAFIQIESAFNEVLPRLGSALSARVER